MVKIILITLLLFGCANDDRVTYSADQFNYQQYAGKMVSHIYYCNGCGAAGDLLKITFSDGTMLKVYAYKYTMKIYK